VPLPQAKLRRYAIVTGLAVATIPAAVFFFLHRAPALTEKDSILIADFVNTTGDPVFDGTLKHALAVDLEQSPFLNVAPEHTTRETLKLMGRSPDERVTPEIGREVCQRQGIKAMLTGSISAVGSQYAIALDSVNCQTGDYLARDQIEAAAKEQVLDALGRAASRLRARLGESLASIQKFDTPLVQATTSSLEALKAYSQGAAARDRGNDRAAIPFFQRAVELDPNFAIAWARLGTVYYNSAESKKADECYRKAFEFRDRVSEPEKFYLDENYYGHVLGDADKEVQILKLWKQTYPREMIAPTNLAVAYEVAFGDFGAAVEEAREALRLDPNSKWGYLHLQIGYVGLGRYAEADEVFRQAVAHKVDDLFIHVNRYLTAIAEGDAEAARQEEEWMKGKPGEYWFLGFVAGWASAQGKFREAQGISRRAAENAQQAGAPEAAAQLIAQQGLSDAFAGSSKRAREQAAAALAISRGRVPLNLAAVALAVSGIDAQAQALAAEITKGDLANTFRNKVVVPEIRAALEINHGRSGKAIDLLEDSRRFELGRFDSYRSLYLRGTAYLSASDGAHAGHEFQKILDHRGTAPTSLLYALARLGLARAYTLQGDKAKARSAYQDFLALWKDADPDIPVLQQAKTEYARLK